jgi:hypothetical protein
MLILPRLLVMVIGAFAPMFSKRVFEPVKRLLVGAILAPGKRTITAVQLVRHWLLARARVVVGAAAYAALEWLEAVRHAVCVIHPLAT